MCLNGTIFIEEDRNQVRNDCLLKAIDIYDNMTQNKRK